MRARRRRVARQAVRRPRAAQCSGVAPCSPGASRSAPFATQPRYRRHVAAGRSHVQRRRHHSHTNEPLSSSPAPSHPQTPRLHKCWVRESASRAACAYTRLGSAHGSTTDAGWEVGLACAVDTHGRGFPPEGSLEGQRPSCERRGRSSRMVGGELVHGACWLRYAARLPLHRRCTTGASRVELKATS
jgi:hypothetical protein